MLETRPPLSEVKQATEGSTGAGGDGAPAEATAARVPARGRRGSAPPRGAGGGGPAPHATPGARDRGGRRRAARTRPHHAAPLAPRNEDGDSHYLSGAAAPRGHGRRGRFPAAGKRGLEGGRAGGDPHSGRRLGPSGASLRRGRERGPALGRRLSHGSRAAKADRGPREGGRRAAPTREEGFQGRRGTGHLAPWPPPPPLQPRDRRFPDFIL